MSKTSDCPSCGIPLCHYTEVYEGEFVLRSGEISHTYTERCRRFLGHRGPHRMKPKGTP